MLRQANNGRYEKLTSGNLLMGGLEIDTISSFAKATLTAILPWGGRGTSETKLAMYLSKGNGALTMDI